MTSGEIKTRDGHAVWQRDSQRKVMTYRYYGEVKDRFFQEEMAKLWTEIPDLAAYHSLSDLREANMNLSWAVIMELSETWQSIALGQDDGTKTAFLVPIDHYDSLIKAISVYFDQIRFGSFLSEDEALEWLLDEE
ncbi:hypothetical protein ACTL6U_15875 [Rhodovibrionaceae bacterium A322]